MCVCIPGGAHEGDSGREGCLLGYTLVQRVGGGRGVCMEQCSARPNVSISPVPALPQGCLAPRKAPFQAVPHTPHPGPAGNGVLLLLLRAAVERSWEELPAHPSHTDLAFMKNLKQQIFPGTCVGVGVKDRLSKIPAIPACACFLLALTGLSLGWPKGCPFLGEGPRVTLATLQCARLLSWPTSQLDRGGYSHG